MELEDIKQFVANTLAGVQDDVSEADDMSEADDVDGEGVSDEEAQSDPKEDNVEVVPDPDLINDAKELKSLINTIESKEYWKRWNDLDESVSMDDDENDNAYVRCHRR